MYTRAVSVGVAIVALAATGWPRAVGGQKEEQAPAHQVCLLKVEGMTCGGCEAAVKAAAKKVEGVKDAKVSYEKGTAEVVYDPAKTTPEAIARAITERSGFKAHAPKKESKGEVSWRGLTVPPWATRASGFRVRS